MAPSGASVHFAISLGIALLAGPAWIFLRRSSGALPMAFSSFLAATAAGLAKEIHDLILNPWKLSPADLRTDSANDMAWNLAGALAGTLLLVLFMAGLSAIVRKAGRSGRTHRGLPPPVSPS